MKLFEKNRPNDDVESIVGKSAIAIFLLVVLALATSAVSSYDIFWQLQSGKFMAQSGEVIHQDTFSLAAEAGRWEHCWLHDLICYALYSLGGYSLLSVLKGALIALTALFLVLAARARGSSWVAILLPGPYLFLQTQAFWIDRPQLWSFMLCAGFLFLFERYRATGSRSVFALLPAHAFWTNLHAGAVLAFPLYFAYMVGDQLDRLVLKRITRQTNLWQWLLLLVGLLAVSGLSPYGWQLLDIFPEASTSGQASGAVTQVQNWDWRTTDFSRFPQLKNAMIAAVVLMVLGWRKFSFVDLLLLCGLGYMSVTLERHAPFWFFAAWVVLPRYLDGVLAWVGSLSKAPIVVLLRPVCLAAALVVAIWISSVAYEMRGFFRVGLLDWQYPVKAVEFIQEQKLPANLFHDYTSGGYLMWVLFPDYRVFWDARQISTRMFQQGMMVSAAQPGWQRVLQEHDVKTIVITPLGPAQGYRHRLVDQLATNSEWPLVYADETFLVFVQRDAVDTEWLAEYQLSKDRIADTILSTARFYTEQAPVRSVAYFEMARVYLQRRQIPEAFAELENYLMRTADPEPLALKYYEMLWPMLNKPGQSVN